MSIGGLFVASNAGFGVAYYGGLLFFVFAVLFVMFLVKEAHDHGEGISAGDEFRAFMAKLFYGGSSAADAPAAPSQSTGRIEIRSIDATDLRDALARGFSDFKEMPTHLVFLVVIYPLVTLVFARISANYDVLPFVFPLLAGYTLIGPLVATGMYELSRRRELGLDISRRHAVSVVRSPRFLAIALLGLILMGVYFTWLWAAWEIYDRIFDGVIPESIADFASLIINTPAGMQLMLVGSSAGFVFATIVFAVSVMSFPMMLDRDVSIVTAIATSVRTCLKNPRTMASWGLIIAGTLLLGAIPFFVGLAFVLPVLGHATWHLYRKAVEA
jgi:uncharacterized membrane protein